MLSEFIRQALAAKRQDVRTHKFYASWVEGIWFMSPENSNNHNNNNNDNDNDNNNNKVARASAAARGVSFVLGRFFGQKLEHPEFCVAFVQKTMFRLFVLFLVRKCRIYHASRL